MIQISILFIPYPLCSTKCVLKMLWNLNESRNDVSVLKHDNELTLQGNNQVFRITYFNLLYQSRVTDIEMKDTTMEMHPSFIQ